MKKNNRKGFTMAELLIVVAIIAVLVAIAIPVFSAQLDKAKLATATASARSAYAEYIADCLSESEEPVLADLTTAVQAAELSDCDVEVTETAITLTSPKGNEQSFNIDLGD